MILQVINTLKNLLSSHVANKWKSNWLTLYLVISLDLLNWNSSSVDFEKSCTCIFAITLLFLSLFYYNTKTKTTLYKWGQSVQPVSPQCGVSVSQTKMTYFIDSVSINHFSERNQWVGDCVQGFLVTKQNYLWLPLPLLYFTIILQV